MDLHYPRYARLKHCKLHRSTQVKYHTAPVRTRKLRTMMPTKKYPLDRFANQRCRRRSASHTKLQPATRPASSIAKKPSARTTTLFIFDLLAGFQTLE